MSVEIFKCSCGEAFGTMDEFVDHENENAGHHLLWGGRVHGNCIDDNARPQSLTKPGQKHPFRASEAVSLPRVQCDGNHGGPPCSDPECWARDSAPVPGPSDTRTWLIAARAAWDQTLVGQNYALIEELRVSGYLAIVSACHWLAWSEQTEVAMLASIRHAIKKCEKLIGAEMDEETSHAIKTRINQVYGSHIVEQLDESIFRDGHLNENDPEFLRRLRYANVSRVPRFGHGDIHDDPETTGAWSPMKWGCAAAGEMGELCNLLKKYERQLPSDPKSDELISSIAEEIADVIIYLDLLAELFGFDLPRVIAQKFNRVSHRYGHPEMVKA